jgi:3',5'-cyclic AMP phosphodiesterase CpdA
MQITRQVVLIHLSDIHFGSKHRFNPPTSPSGDVPKEYEYPTLLEKLREDLDHQDPECPVMICITGDFAETAALEEFNLAEKFIDELAQAKLLGKERG